MHNKIKIETDLFFYNKKTKNKFEFSTKCAFKKKLITLNVSGESFVFANVGGNVSKRKQKRKPLVLH